MHDLIAPRVVRLRFHCQATTAVELPPFTGSAWRGLLGTALRRAVCVARQPACTDCLLTERCAFHALFESTDAPPATDADGRYRTPSHPYVLDLLDDGDRCVPPGAGLALGVNLLGGADALLPYLIYALQQGGELGLGRGHGRFRLLLVTAETDLGGDDWVPVWRADAAGLRAIEPTPAPLPPAPTGATVALRTPLRIKRRGALVGPADGTAAEFLRHLCYRLDQLELLYGVADAPVWWPRHRRVRGPRHATMPRRY